MNKKSLISLAALLICIFLPIFLCGCGSDDNNDFNIYFIELGTNSSPNFYANKPLEKIVSDDLKLLNSNWQTTIMNEKDAIQEFVKFSESLENEINKQVREGQLALLDETYFTLVLSHSVKHGQNFPVIATCKITLSE